MASPYNAYYNTISDIDGFYVFNYAHSLSVAPGAALNLYNKLDMKEISVLDLSAGIINTNATISTNNNPIYTGAITTNNNSINVGTGKIIGGTLSTSVGINTYNISTASSYYDFEWIDSSSNLLNSANSLYDLSLVKVVANQTFTRAPSTTPFFGSNVLRQTVADVSNASYYVSNRSNFGSNGFSVSLWTKHSGDSTNRMVCLIANSGGTELFAISLTGYSVTNDCSMNLHYVNTGVNLNQTASYNTRVSSIPANTWFNIIATVYMNPNVNANTTITLYVNGSAITSGITVTASSFVGASTGNNIASNSSGVITLTQKLFTGTSYNFYLGGFPKGFMQSTTAYTNHNSDIDGVYLFNSSLPAASATALYANNVNTNANKIYVLDASLNLNVSSVTCGTITANGDDLNIIANQNINIKGNQTTGTTARVLISGAPLYVDVANDSNRLLDNSVNGGYIAYFHKGFDATLTSSNLYGFPVGAAYGNPMYAIYAKGRIVTSDEYQIMSDKRIKKDIQSIEDSSSLEIIRIISPKLYKRIEDERHAIGFIAQEIMSILPIAVSINEDYIPNIYELASVSGDNLDLITLKSKSTSLFNLNCESNIGLKVKLRIKGDNSHIVHIKEIIDNNTFRVTKSIPISGLYDSQQVFVYGQEVFDFLTLEKNTIFALAVGAIKQVDKELQETKKTIAVQQSQIDGLKSEIELLKTLIYEKK
jgi:hypothetical protein